MVLQHFFVCFFGSPESGIFSRVFLKGFLVGIQGLCVDLLPKSVGCWKMLFLHPSIERLWSVGTLEFSLTFKRDIDL